MLTGTLLMAMEKPHHRHRHEPLTHSHLPSHSDGHYLHDPNEAIPLVFGYHTHPHTHPIQEHDRDHVPVIHHHHTHETWDGSLPDSRILIRRNPLQQKFRLGI